MRGARRIRRLGTNEEQRLHANLPRDRAAATPSERGASVSLAMDLNQPGTPSRQDHRICWNRPVDTCAKRSSRNRSSSGPCFLSGIDLGGSPSSLTAAIALLWPDVALDSRSTPRVGDDPSGPELRVARRDGVGDLYERMESIAVSSGRSARKGNSLRRRVSGVGGRAPRGPRNRSSPCLWRIATGRAEAHDALDSAGVGWPVANRMASPRQRGSMTDRAGYSRSFQRAVEGVARFGQAEALALVAALRESETASSATTRTTVIRRC